LEKSSGIGDPVLDNLTVSQIVPGRREAASRPDDRFQTHVLRMRPEKELVTH
jgi:hypothetical protein